ncbi:MAG UNVERIFIED_CONTAM: hypothetical protein LVR29_02970 [Microcystis novacekii LVE1205-3]
MSRYKCAPKSGTERTGFTIAHFAATLILDDQSAEVPLSTVTVPDRP